MKKILGLSLLVGLLFLSGCAISHTYGPYMGKVVEKGTGEPIEGAVVFMEFYTWAGSIGGEVNYYADAVETLTDAKGEFLIPPHSTTTFRFLNGWREEGYAIIFKPGYGVFPRHPRVTRTHPSGTIPANEPVLIELPRIMAKEERLENHRDVLMYDTMEVPCEKQRLILKTYNSESALMGLESVMNNCGENQYEK